MKKLILAMVILSSTIPVWGTDGSSGCGPGWYVSKENSILSSALRITTNAIFFPTVTLGMTFGTSNCTKHKLVQTEKESLKYASENYYELLSETAIGEGDFLTQFSDVIGCDRGTLPIFKKQMRDNFNKVFPAHKPDAERVLLETYQIILKDNSLLQSCSLPATLG